MTLNRIPVEINSRKLDVAVYEDRSTTEAAARQVSVRLREIEEKSSRIDTHAFAIEAAVSFAAELQTARTAREAEIREIRKVFERIQSDLRGLLDDFPTNAKEKR